MVSKYQEQSHVAIAAATEASRNGCPAVHEAGADCFFAIPLGDQTPLPWFGIGKLTAISLPTARTLVSVACEAVQRASVNHGYERALESAERELKHAHAMSIFLRNLNSKHTKRITHECYSARQAVDAACRFLHAEVVAAYVESDTDRQKHPLQSIVSTGSEITIDDISYLLKKYGTPNIGDALHVQNLRIRINKTRIRSLDIIPISESEVLGYMVAVNAQFRSDFLHARTEILQDVSDFLIVEGHTNAAMHESEQLALGILHSMSIAIEARDPYTHGHSERVAQFGLEISRRMGLPESACKEIFIAGTLHDIGKIGVPDAVLLKPDRLSLEEFAVIKQHPEIGYKIVDGIGSLKFALPGILYHHERYDGEGYPHKLKGDEIPLMARILAVADAFDAMTRNRVYRSAMTSANAIRILSEGRNTQWDARAVDACLQWIQSVEKHAVLETIEDYSFGETVPAINSPFSRV
ncbi:HD-GYP domain-containing protein [Pirellulaceae bacterium SH449]